MADQAVLTTDNTKVDTTQTDVKPTEQLLGGDSKTVTKDPAADIAKAGGDATKTPDQIKAEADAKAKDGDAKTGDDTVPDKYEFKTPENVVLDKEIVGEFEAVAKELNLTNGKAQKFVDMAVKHTEKLQKTMQDANIKAWEQTREKWVSELKTDKEVGGSDTALAQARDVALRARDKFGKDLPGLKEVLDSGFGSNPGLFKFFYRVGKALMEDKTVDGTNAAPVQSFAKGLYPSLQKKT